MSLQKIKFKPDEKIIIKAHQYGLTLWWAWFLVVVMLAVPFFFMFWLFNHGWWGQLLFFLPVIFAIFFFFKTLYIWQRNAFIVTTHRIIDIDRRVLFDKVLTIVTYDQVEDVSGRIRGVFGTIFGYGEVVVGTGGGKVQLTAVKIKNPIDLQDQINELRDKLLKRSAQEFNEELSVSILDKLNELDMSELIKIKKGINKQIEKLNRNY
jgi:membrane protein YdbS with pleckstrin-like domain